MRVIGTAGHVDHGKSALVEALTGIDPDRLQEEKARQMTIDLGFAWMTLPSGQGLGIVDVPGHRDFIENMLAGVGAINAGLLVVAADEGIMPQTREHLAILDLLEIPQLVVALTKIDLVGDPDWLGLVREDLGALLLGTRYRQPELVEVSATEGLGLDRLVRALDRALAQAPAPRDIQRPRMYVDRVFSLAGFGTVVTGTLLDGELAMGEEVEVLPAGPRARIRGLQTHRERIERAVPASRVALNLSGVSVDQVRRGDVVARPGTDRVSTALDVRLRMWQEAPAPLEHDMQLKLFIGSAQRMVKARLFGEERIEPGETGWLRLVMDEPVAVRRGDRLIVRRPSPSDTLGGGQVADPLPPRHYRRNDPDRVQALRQLLDGSDAERLLQAVDGRQGQTLREAAERAGLDLESAEAVVRQAAAREELVVIDPERPVGDWELVSAGGLRKQAASAREAVEAYHRRYPARIGIPREELRSRLDDASGAMVEALIQRGQLKQHGARVALPDFSPRLSERDRASVEALLARFHASPRTPPSIKECQQAVGVELYHHLVQGGQLVPVSESVVFDAETYRQLVEQVRLALEAEGSLTVAELRDHFGTTRKYALALLEHLDLIGLTYREGDARKLVGAADRS